MSNEITVIKCPTCGAGLPHINEELVKCCYCGNICMIQFKKTREKIQFGFQETDYITSCTGTSARLY